LVVVHVVDVTRTLVVQTEDGPQQFVSPLAGFILVLR
jgi:hypothetical protein